jgi:hypothetical protein
MQVEELHEFYSSRNVIRIKSRRMRCEVRVACIQRSGIHIGVWSEGQNEEVLG